MPDMEQVSAITERKLVRGSQKEIAEVRGAIRAYEALSKYQADFVDDLLSAHQKMTEEILPNAGHFRRKNVGIHKHDKVVHLAPKPSKVASLQHYDLVGPVCESGDFLALDCPIDLAEGDVVAVLDTGAYGFSMSSNYNTRPRPAEVLVDGAHTRIIRHRESMIDLLASESDCLSR